MSVEADVDLSSIEASLVVAIQALECRDRELAPIECVKLHALVLNLQTVRELKRQARSLRPEASSEHAEKAARLAAL